MNISHRCGIAAGFALSPAMFGILFGYYAPDLVPSLGPWLWIAAPILTWLGAETAARLGRQARWLGYLLALAAAAGAGVSWWWQHGLYVWGGGSTLASLTTPTVVVGVYVLLAIVSGRLLRRTSSTVRVDEFDHIPQ